MRIALFTTSFPSNAEIMVNAGACVRDFASALTGLGHEVQVLTPYKRNARHEFAHAGTTFFPWLGRSESLTHISMRQPFGLVQLGSIVAMGSIAASRLIERFRPDHVLCFWVFPCALWAELGRLWRNTPFSVWALGSDIWSVGKLPGFSRVLGHLGRQAEHCYADGMGLAADFGKLTGTPVEFLATSRLLEVPSGIPQGQGGYFLYLGRYHTNKGIDLLVEAVARARHELPASFRLRAHGFGPLEREVRERVRTLGLESVVEILGTTSATEVASVLRRARGLIIPSRLESIPLVLSDALQMDLPLLVTDVGDMGRLVREHHAGMVCRPEIEDMARALAEFVCQPPKERDGTLREKLDIRESARRFIEDVTRGTVPPR